MFSRLFFHVMRIGYKIIGRSVRSDQTTILRLKPKSNMLMERTAMRISKKNTV